jgi:DNA polymerase-1
MSITHEKEIATILRDGTYINSEMWAMREYRSEQIVAFDLETTGAPGTKDGLSHKKGAIAVVALHAPGKAPIVLHYPRGSNGPSTTLMHFLERRILVGHNITAFDIPFCMKYGFRPFKSVGWIDTLIAEQLALTSGRRDLRRDLGTTLNRRLNIIIKKEMSHEGWGNEWLNEEQLEYVLDDVTLLLKMWKAQQKAISENGLDSAWELERAIFPITANMIGKGMPLDLDALDKFEETNQFEFEQLINDLLESIGTDAINSPKKIKAAFDESYTVKLPNTTRDTMLKLSGRADEVGRAAAAVQHAKEHKKRGMYNSKWLDKYYYNGRVNSRYKPLGTDTSRYSSHDPNMQQIPSNMRGIFGYPEGSDRVLLKCDYGQIEVLIFAILTGEQKLIDWYRGGRDVHTEVAAAIYQTTQETIMEDKKNNGNLRKTAKAATFAMLFAGGKRSVIATARKEGVELSDEEAGRIIRQFFRNFPNASGYIQKKREEADKALVKGYAITLRLPNGPKRSLYGADITASRLVNTMVQGTAAVGLKMGLVECIKANIAQYIVSVVHDEVILDLPRERVEEVQPILEQCMKDGMKSIIGLEPKVESAWGTHWSR